MLILHFCGKDTTKRAKYQRKTRFSLYCYNFVLQRVGVCLIYNGLCPEGNVVGVALKGLSVGHAEQQTGLGRGRLPSLVGQYVRH